MAASSGMLAPIPVVVAQRRGSGSCAGKPWPVPDEINGSFPPEISDHEGQLT